MLEVIKGAYNSLKTASDIAQGIIALKTETEKNAAVINIQRHVLEGQRALMEADALHATDLRRIGELEQEIVRLEDWSAERERYELIGIRGGAFTYMPKAGMENGQPAHWLCANCFDHGRKSILQNKGQTRQGSGEESYGCDRCKGSFVVMSRSRPVYQREQV